MQYLSSDGASLYGCSNARCVKQKHCKLLSNMLHSNVFKAVYQSMSYPEKITPRQVWGGNHTHIKIFFFKKNPQ